jgi:hypothetical protein
VPLFMDVHECLPEGTTARRLAEFQRKAMEVQQKWGVRYLRYWVDEGARKMFCLVEAPSVESAVAVHREAHGLLADRTYQVQEGSRQSTEE